MKEISVALDQSLIHLLNRLVILFHNKTKVLPAWDICSLTCIPLIRMDSSVKKTILLASYLKLLGNRHPHQVQPLLGIYPQSQED